MSDPLNVKVILGSSRQNRFSELPGAWLMKQLEKRADLKPEMLDLRDYPMPFFDEAVTPSSKKEEYKNATVEQWRQKIQEADAFIVITPEYNHGYPAILKNAFDYVYPEWNNKPIGYISYGSAMGARSVEQLRMVAIELQMAPIRNAIHMPWSIVEAGRKDAATAFTEYEGRVVGLVDQLLWWGNALKEARNK